MTETPRIDKARKELADALAKADELKRQAKARYQAALSRESAKQRKADTRRKIILGGALMDMSEKSPEIAALVARIVANLQREQDKTAFKEWETPESAKRFTPSTDSASPSLKPQNPHRA